MVTPGLEGVLIAAGRSRPFNGDDLDLLSSLARQGALAIDNARSQVATSDLFGRAAELLLALLEARDPGHRQLAQAVAALCSMLAEKLGLPEEERRTLHYAGLLHDTGMLLLPTTSSPGARRAPDARLGMELLRPFSPPGALAALVHGHGERWDGQGGPRGLAGRAIPLGSRVVAIARAFESTRRADPHGGRGAAERALERVAGGAGHEFDPELASLFVDEYRRRRASLGLE
jgi:HD-GYP domain-containing protein (c-di-GMP phosphodiesterase class II)